MCVCVCVCVFHTHTICYHNNNGVATFFCYIASQTLLPSSFVMYVECCLPLYTFGIVINERILVIDLDYLYINL